MAAQGRKPKPASLHQLEGNPGKREIKEPVKTDLKFPSCPSWVNEYGKREWNRMAKILDPIKLVDDIHRSCFAVYCHNYGLMVHYAKEIAKHGDTVENNYGYIKKSPYVEMYNQAEAAMQKAAVEFGLTPSAQTRVDALTKSNKKVDDMEELLGGE